MGKGACRGGCNTEVVELEVEVDGPVREGSVHAAHWRYSRVGTLRTALPSDPQWTKRSACGATCGTCERRNARGVKAGSSAFGAVVLSA